MEWTIQRIQICSAAHYPGLALQGTYSLSILWRYNVRTGATIRRKLGGGTTVPERGTKQTFLENMDEAENLTISSASNNTCHDTIDEFRNQVYSTMYSMISVVETLGEDYLHLESILFPVWLTYPRRKLPCQRKEKKYVKNNSNPSPVQNNEKNFPNTYFLKLQLKIKFPINNLQIIKYILFINPIIRYFKCSKFSLSLWPKP